MPHVVIFMTRGLMTSHSVFSTPMLIRKRRPPSLSAKSGIGRRQRKPRPRKTGRNGRRRRSARKGKALRKTRGTSARSERARGRVETSRMRHSRRDGSSAARSLCSDVQARRTAMRRETRMPPLRPRQLRLSRQLTCRPYLLSTPLGSQFMKTTRVVLARRMYIDDRPGLTSVSMNTTNPRRSARRTYVVWFVSVRLTCTILQSVHLDVLCIALAIV